MKVVHLGTTIQTVFAVVDDEGNAIAQEPIVAAVQAFNREKFVEAFERIEQARDAASTGGGQPPTA